MSSDLDWHAIPDRVLISGVGAHINDCGAEASLAASRRARVTLWVPRKGRYASDNIDDNCRHTTRPSEDLLKLIQGDQITCT